MHLFSPHILAPLAFVTSATLYFWAWWLYKAAPESLVMPASLLREKPESERGRQLQQAGFTHPDAVRLFSRIRLLVSLLAAVAGALIGASFLGDHANATLIVLMLGMTAGLFGFTLPTLYVDRRRARMQRLIRRATPDAIDFMQVCMEAGQSIDAALLRVTSELESMHPELAARFRDMTDALAAGASREAAFEQLARDADNDDLRQFANMMEQSLSMGSSITHTLRVFTNDLRDQRVRETEAKANVLPTKMTLGSMMFTVPPLLLLLLTPAVLRLLDVF